MAKRDSLKNRRFLLIAPRAALGYTEEFVPVISVGLLVAMAARDR